MTVRTYEEKYSPCAICCEPAMCATSRHVDIRVEGGPLVPFAVCESCVRNMMKPFDPFRDVPVTYKGGGLDDPSSPVRVAELFAAAPLPKTRYKDPKFTNDHSWGSGGITQHGHNREIACKCGARIFDGLNPPDSDLASRQPCPLAKEKR